jgi:hypothetical protein
LPTSTSRVFDQDESRPLPAPVSEYFLTAGRVLASQLLPILLLSALMALLEAFSGVVRHGWVWLVFAALLLQPARYAYAVVCLDAVRGAPVDETSFDGMRRHYRALAGAGALSALLVVAGLCLLIVPGLIAYLRTRFVPYLIVEEGMSATEALRESFRRTRGLEWPLLWISAAGALSTLIGFALGFVGAIPAIALWELARAALYADAGAQNRSAPQYS